ncbi:undecaprenyl-phosphate 4-deoxy-4-formamido-L-arabinose transferase [Butyrivibrio hungatei DSM 14810]|uniref:Glycosyl transferase GT2 family n=2 Tax=Butyrivibrio hungatei TaxID=185008 RepID=A0A1D9P533_9FIRM|nr:glycosyltransferase family 2 protein [Butyrivibrio hungatei]AOZ97444.1 glycosyl transferase GT2 family [Butyrivibrio hungatei]SHN51816.1 undecaprenyl-phosphate 4-deoxy-4-formamido-L-arabinose transferase [Butyrivibrio hungatei DSM 14810]
MKKKLVSFVIPCYRSEKTLEAVINEIEETMNGSNDYDYEILLVNDGSPDNTWDVIRKIAAERDKDKVIGINFAKNFGQHAALMAGLGKSKGDYVVCLDDDGQTPANEVFKLLDALNDGSDAVYARYGHKQHSLFRNFGTAMNEWMASVMLGKPKELFVSSYFAVRRFVVDEMIKYESSYPYVIGLVLRTTKRIVNVDVNHRKREVGASGYTFSKLMALWINGFTAFSIKPLRIATLSGTIFAFLGFLYGIFTVIKKFVNPNVPVGFSALMSAMIFIGGMLMLMMGMVGEYLGRVYISQNRNPQYVIRETTLDEE